MRQPPPLAPVLLVALLAGPAGAQDLARPAAILDTARPFAAGAEEIQQLLRGPIGWPTYQQGQAGELFFRIDPDGYARFGHGDRLDQDYWEATCTPKPPDCTARRGPVRLSVGPDGRPAITVEGALPGARFGLAGPEGAMATAAELSAPERAGALLEADSLAPEDGSEPLPVDGLAAVAAYLRWVEQGQAPDLAFDARPRRPFAPLPEPAEAAPKPAPAAEAAPSPPEDAGNVATPPASPAAALAAPATAEAPAPPVPDTPLPTGPALALAAPAAVPAPAGPAQDPPPATAAAPDNPAADTSATPPAGPAATLAAPATAEAPAPPAPDAPLPTGPAVALAAPAIVPAPAGPEQAEPPAPAATPATSAPAPGAAACTPARIAPAEIQKPIDSLRGLPGVLVVADYLVEPPALQGKLRSGVQAEIERRFQEAGIRMLSEDEVETTPGQPRLELYLTPGDATKGCVFRVWMSLRQEVVLARDTSIHLLTGTWGDGGVARTGGTQGPELETFIYYIDRFVADYQAANSGQPRPAATPVAPPRPPATAPAAPAGGQDLVRPIQTLLRESGYDPGAADGRMGPRTQAAIEAFEGDHDLPVTGKPSQVLLERLLGRRPDGPS